MNSAKIEKTLIEGLYKISSDEWDGELYQFSRETFIKNKDHPFLNRVGIYIIYADHFDKNKYGNEIYIGQGDDVRLRLLSHSKKKLFWNKVILLTSERMNIAIAFNIEKALLNAAKLANRYCIDNEDKGQLKKLEPSDNAYMKSFISNSLNLISLTQIDIFRFNEDGIFTNKNRDCCASIRIASPQSNHVVIISGSEFHDFEISDAYITKHCIENIIIKKDHKVTFIENHETAILTNVLVSIIESINLSKFENSCGISMAKLLKDKAILPRYLS